MVLPSMIGRQSISWPMSSTEMKRRRRRHQSQELPEKLTVSYNGIAARRRPWQIIGGERHRLELALTCSWERRSHPLSENDNDADEEET